MRIPHRVCAARVEWLEPRLLFARSDTLINAAWRFTRADVAGAAGTAFNDAAWSNVSLPHTWNNLDGQDGGNNYYRGPAWYRKQLWVSSSCAGHRLFLKFDAASLVADLYVNGTYVGQHLGGFAAFTYDVTSLLKTGANNLIAVKVNNARRLDLSPRGGDFTVFGGIYRDVHLIAADPVHIDPLDYSSPGVYVKQTNVSAASADVQVTTRVRNDRSSAVPATVTATIFDKGNIAVTTLTSTVTVPAGSTLDVVQKCTLLNPHLWQGRDDPYLYRVHIKLTASGSIDELNQPLGLRSFSLSASSGFKLNNKSYPLNGVNLHQDRLNKGWAIAPGDRDQDIDLLEETGATMARLAHYQHAQETYDRLDREGIVAWSEIPIINEILASTKFTDNALTQLREMIRQNYNHPSILFWGLFNELNESTDTNNLVVKLDAAANAEDPTRVTVAATDEPDDRALNWRTDATAFNKYFGWYYGKAGELGPWADAIHAKYPTKRIALSEFGAGGSIAQHRVPPGYVAANGTFHPEEFQNQQHETFWNAIKSKAFLWSKLVWNLFDFAADARVDGDTPGRNDKGLITYDRKTKKDAFFWYKTNWSSEPVLYITSRRFTNRTDPTTEVKVYSNLASVTLKINGKSYGAKTSTNRIFKWDVTLTSGSNNIEVTALRGLTTCTDTCVWNYTPATATLTASTPQSGSGRINAALAIAPTWKLIAERDEVALI